MSLLTFLLTFIVIAVIVVTGTMANARLFDTGHHGKRFGRSRQFKPITRRPMTDVEYYTRLDKAYDEGPRYARRGLLYLAIFVIVVLIVLISFLLGVFHF